MQASATHDWGDSASTQRVCDFGRCSSAMAAQSMVCRHPLPHAMDPVWLFQLLSLGFALAAVLRVLRSGRLQGAARTWAVMALIFGAVSAWLHWHA